MYNEVITLVKETYGKDQYGNEIVTGTTSREVFAKVQSVGMREFYTAAQTDYKPECTAILADYRDYEGEQKIVWNDDKYRVIRTYRNGKRLEITLERRIGDMDDEEEVEDNGGQSIGSNGGDSE